MRYRNMMAMGVSPDDVDEGGAAKVRRPKPHKSVPFHPPRRS